MINGTPAVCWVIWFMSCIIEPANCMNWSCMLPLPPFDGSMTPRPEDDDKDDDEGCEHPPRSDRMRVLRHKVVMSTSVIFDATAADSS